MTKRKPATASYRFDSPEVIVGPDVADIATADAPPAAEPAPVPRSQIATAALDDWFTGYIHGTALSRNTRAYNEAHAAYQRLRGFLAHLDD
jgi:hypothetical protein